MHVIGEGQVDGVGAAHARAVVLATGGLGQLFTATTNPSVATGDGMAIALRAGAVMEDVEFVQFHPTVLWLGEEANGQQPLISEAVRGEGAFLVDRDGPDGVRFMPGVHELGDLAPRDVVSRAIVARMRDLGTDHVFLDARHLGREFLERRFPSIVASLRSHGFDLAADLVPVAPAQHYASGGVKVDLHGPVVPRRAVRLRRGLLLGCPRGQPAGLQLSARGARLRPPHRRRHHRPVRGRRAGARRPRPRGRPAHDGALLGADHRRDVQRAMTAGSGVVRSADSLAATADALASLAKGAEPGDETPGPAAWQATNLLQLGQVLTQVAALREETRGGHLRSDFPDRDDEHWLGHLRSVRGVDGLAATSYHRVTEEPPS